MAKNDRIVIDWGGKIGKIEGIELERAYDKDSSLKYVKCRFDITNVYGVFITKRKITTCEKWIDIQYVGWIR